MGIALLALSSLFQGFSALNRKPCAGDPVSPPQPVRALRMVRPSLDRTAVTIRPVSSICSPRSAALRVVRVRDAQAPSDEMGRMVISGRMADVCAELDRLAAHEARLQAQTTRR